MIDDDDTQLFRRTVGPVKRLTHDRAAAPAKRPKPVPREHDAIHTELQDQLSDGGEPLALGDLLEFQRPGVQHRLMLRLRQGRLAVEGELDLHGQTAEQARMRLPQFLAQAQAAGLRCVCIVHGKGYRSPDQRPVLKSLLNNWLPQCPQVLAYCSALPKDGGTGAVYVLLRGG
ncbi:Smr/MutS family protein [Methylogaea oryzae]|uniref:DNA mismatch repair protein MutS n=1 Tax=Methylogaea oryzae TaxID=1295382 RepID=A0A8D5AK80_9GAMM|nr:Smr/MutS family protein [Methylogaea oryzae]BBL70831.1 DNA mismatch repair protein MutS [Methylogaea oryzae]